MRYMCAALQLRHVMQEGAGFADFALDLKNPDFVKYAEAYGAKGYRIREVR